MSGEIDTKTREAIIAVNLAAVEQHFHNENPEVSTKPSRYTPMTSCGIPARGWCCGIRRRFKREYLGIFESMQVHQITNLYRFATEEWVFDDSIFEITLTSDGFRNCPFPVGTRCSMRLIHAFEMRDGKICRENGYEIWRRADDTARVQDDIPEHATSEVFS